MTRAWADRTTGDKFAGTAGGDEPPFSRTDLAAIDPRLPGFLLQYKLPVVPVATYTFEQDGGKTPEVVDTYTGPGFAVTVTSVAARVDDGVRVYTNVTARGDVTKDASFSMPALQALNLLQQEQDQLNEYRNFLDLYIKMKEEALVNKGEWRFETAIEAPKSKPVRVFRVSNPISIRHGDARDCIMVTSFAPIAVNFSTQECHSLLHN